MMMADAPTMGGYPKIATIASADLPLLVQCIPTKGRIRFRETTVEKAQLKRCRHMPWNLRRMESISGQRVRIETLCLHGDHPHAAQNAKRVREALQEAG